MEDFAIRICGHTPQVKVSLFRKTLCLLQFHKWGAGMMGSSCKYCYADCLENQPWHWQVTYFWWKVKEKFES